ncbi:hypothetical protein B0H16DRAFT_540589 [Mycena metata]|uniref:Uncharacterized protein n=1 Tax=Mycena metata TaxID=1033252 RepID=A0AAD7JFV0_9AGAR|nr:hypothetical protein B0H16DRAFT_540589 [Mycena metata]
MTSMTPPTSPRRSRTPWVLFLPCGTWQMSKYHADAEGLAWRAFDILNTIFNVGGGGVGPVSPTMLGAIKTFVGLLHEISAAMEQELELARLNMQSRDPRLTQFITRLDVMFEAFKIGSADSMEEQPAPATVPRANMLRTIPTVIRMPHVSGGIGGSGGRGGIAGGAGGVGVGHPNETAAFLLLFSGSVYLQ